MPKEPVTYRPGWNGKPYKGDNWVVANTMIPSRPLTQKERTDQANAIKKILEKKGKTVKLTKDENGMITISVSGRKK
jgi:hypothetical protein